MTLELRALLPSLPVVSAAGNYTNMHTQRAVGSIPSGPSALLQQGEGGIEFSPRLSLVKLSTRGGSWGVLSDTDVSVISLPPSCKQNVSQKPGTGRKKEKSMPFKEARASDGRERQSCRCCPPPPALRAEGMPRKPRKKKMQTEISARPCWHISLSFNYCPFSVHSSKSQNWYRKMESEDSAN